MQGAKTAMNIKTALIVEDHDDSRDWLSEVLGTAFPGIAIDAVDSIAAAHAALAQQVPDLALIDLRLPDGSGVELIGHLSRLAPLTISVVASVFSDDQHVFPALRAGARGYVLKDQTADELVPLLRGIVNGQPPLSPAIANRLLQFFRPLPDAGEDDLTARETEVLSLIAKGLTVARVGQSLGITHHTAAGYVKDIYRKLSISTRAEAALEAARRGVIGRFSE